MRTICFIVLFGAWILMQDATPFPHQGGTSLGATASDWRRTMDGWEHASTWRITTPDHQPSLHPAIVAALQVGMAAIIILASSSLLEGEIVGTAKKDA